MLIVRSATLIDSKRIKDVSAYLGYADVSLQETHHRLQTLLASKTDTVCVAEWDGQVIGWIHYFFARRLASASFHEIGGLVVVPEYRGRGIGQALVTHATRQHRGKWRVRCHEARLETHRFYESLDFSGCKSQRVFEKTID